jgi:mono/diheme cytochrome c family protein
MVVPKEALMKYIIFAIIGLIITSNVAMAGCRTFARGSYYTYSTTCQYPVVAKEVIVEVPTPVITPVAVPVLIPAYQFQYVAPVAPVAAPIYGVQGVPVYGSQGVPVYGSQGVPVQQGVPMQPMSYGPGVSSISNDQEKIRLLARALLAEMNSQSENGGQDDGPPMAADAGHASSNPISILANRCSACHTGPSAKGGVQIFTTPGQFNQAVDRQRILKAVEDGRMPPQAVNDPKFRLSPQEIAGLRSGLR